MVSGARHLGVEESGAPGGRVYVARLGRVLPLTGSGLTGVAFRGFFVFQRVNQVGHRKGGFQFDLKPTEKTPGFLI